MKYLVLVSFYNPDMIQLYRVPMDTDPAEFVQREDTAEFIISTDLHGKVFNETSKLPVQIYTYEG